MGVLQDPEEFGKRVAAARSYAGFKKPAFAKAVGSSVPTITRWEKGVIGSIGATVPARLVLAQRVIAATGCPPGWFGLGASSADGGEAFATKDELDRSVQELSEALDEVRGDLASVHKLLSQGGPGSADDQG